MGKKPSQRTIDRQHSPNVAGVATIAKGAEALTTSQDMTLK